MVANNYLLSVSGLDSMTSSYAIIFVYFALTRDLGSKAMLTSSQLLYSFSDTSTSAAGLAEPILPILLHISIGWNLRRTYLQECRRMASLYAP
jgi:hypothetical protein